MDMNEFNATAKRSENETTIAFDVRPFGEKQGEAVDSYLHEALGAVQQGRSTFGSRPIVVLCDETAEIPATAQNWLANLRERGVNVAIQQAEK